MATISNIALSGMSAAQAQLNVSANNIANMNTEGFKRQELQQSQQTGGGVTTTVTRSPTEGSALEADIVSQLQAKNAFLANLAVFKTSNQMTGALLDKTA
jgi:flagellar hook-associated protein FlgK